MWKKTTPKASQASVANPWQRQSNGDKSENIKIPSDTPPGPEFSSPRSLTDVMSEQLAEKMVNEQSSEMLNIDERQRVEPVIDRDDVGFNQEEIQKAINLSMGEEDQSKVKMSSCKSSRIAAKASKTGDSDLDISNDALLAKLLQKQLDQEYNDDLSKQQAKFNSKGKINYSFDKYKVDLSSDDSNDENESLEGHEGHSEEDDNFFSNQKSFGSGRRRRKSETLNDRSGPTVQIDYNSDDDECPEIYEDLYRPKKLVGREERFDPVRNEWINKHDIIEGNKSNALKLDTFPMQCKTGNMKDLSLSNKIYNSLKVHAYDQKRQQARLHEDKEKSTAEHAVDKRTRLILHKCVNSGTLEEINGVISIGKEAVVLHAKGGTQTPLNQNSISKPVPENIAIKVFKTMTSEFKNREQYIADDYRFESRFRKVNSKKFANLWAEKEMRNLERLHRVGIACPEVVLLRKHILMMRFIGTTTETGGSDASAAPKLSEYLIRPEIKLPTLVRAYQQTVEIMKKMYREAKLVHADLSAYNLLWHENKVWVIDTAQAVEPQHPKALKFLYRDCLNICKFFGGKLKIKEVPNPRSLFFDICDICMEGVVVEDSSFQNFDPTSAENAEFFGKLEELQLRAKKRLNTRKGLDYVTLEDGTIAIDDI